MSQVKNKFLAQMAAHTYKGNNTGSTANPVDVTSTQLTADLNLFTSSLQGLTPSSGGGTSNFLRADGSWASPPSGSSPEYNFGNSTSSTTLNFTTTGTAMVVTLAVAATTFTFSNPTSGDTYDIRLVQDSTGGRTVVWPTSVKWPGGIPPRLSTAPNAVDLITIYYSGNSTNYYGTFGLAFA